MRPNLRFLNPDLLMPTLLDDFQFSKDPKIDPNAKAALRPHIGERVEQLRWAIQPKQGVLLRKQEGCLMPFFWVFFLFAVAWETIVITTSAGWVMTLWGVPFVLVGGYMAFGRLFHDAWYRRKVYYGLTEERLYILRHNQLEAHALQYIRQLKYVPRSKGHGDILFAQSDLTTARTYNNTIPSKSTRLDCIPMAEQLYDWMHPHTAA